MKKNSHKILLITFNHLKNQFLIFFAFTILYLLAVFWLMGKVNESQQEIVLLKAKVVPQAESVNNETLELLSDRAVNFASFLPDEFNIYQVINLIEQIGKKTKFKIQSYNLNYVEGSVNQVQHQALSIQGSGTLEQFMAFLKEYKFITGQLLTIDSVNLSGDKRLLTNLEINIYAFKPDVNIQGEVINALDDIDRLIVRKIDQYRVTQSTETPDSNYESSGNPFN